MTGTPQNGATETAHGQNGANLSIHKKDIFIFSLETFF
jgi:hypothetical protein